jgi:hypothetical protein
MIFLQIQRFFSKFDELFSKSNEIFFKMDELFLKSNEPFLKRWTFFFKICKPFLIPYFYFVRNRKIGRFFPTGSTTKKWKKNWAASERPSEQRIQRNERPNSAVVTIFVFRSERACLWADPCQLVNGRLHRWPWAIDARHALPLPLLCNDKGERPRWVGSGRTVHWWPKCTVGLFRFLFLFFCFFNPLLFCIELVHQMNFAIY